MPFTYEFIESQYIVVLLKDQAEEMSWVRARTEHRERQKEAGL